MNRVEVAAALGLTVRQVRSAESKALAKLLEAWRDVGIDASDADVLTVVLRHLTGEPDAPDAPTCTDTRSNVPTRPATSWRVL